MDDYNIPSLTEAKNEYSIRLITILTPLVIEGLKSILKEAITLCTENDQEEKYLMTFQNFLSRIPKWNQTIINDETKRIISKSNCNYLEDLLTCVHITQLKVLSCIRVGQKQKKVDIDIPKLSDFIHKIYIKCSRKLYTNIYLFETNIQPLVYQKNMRECEKICKECIMNVIRDSVPVENILRAYMDETIEDEILEDIVDETKKEEEKEVTKINTDKKEISITKKDNDESITENTDKKLEENMEKIPEENTNNEMKINTESIKDAKKGLSFNDKDQILDMETNKETLVSAPKNIERLEKISEERTRERKLEEEEDDDDEENDKITIHNTNTNIELDKLDVQVVDKELKLEPDPILTDIEVI